MPKRDQIPPCPDVPPAKPDVASVHSYEIQLMTPMFGGGAVTRENDPSFPIRGTSIRGQLQFWWRATVGAQYQAKEELRAAQSDVWGDTSQASRVQIRVEDVQVTKPEPCARYDMDRNRPGTYRSMPTWNAPFSNTALPYALFPFQGQLANDRTRIEVEPASCIHNAKFRLTVISHKAIDFAKQVEPALWAWVNFGGLGSRTRRGCGAIKCQQLLAKDRNDLLARLKGYLSDAAPKEWPTLAAAFLIGVEGNNPIDAWKDVIERFQIFRQRKNVGRNPGTQPDRPGRSRWPEPETIRQVTGQRSRQHTRIEHIPNDAFPRAELGLPIVFHFQGQGEPPDTVLYPDNDSEGNQRERMASPLILKPLALLNGKAVPLILRLRTPALTGVDLRIKKKDISSLRGELADQVRSTMQPNDNEGSLPLPNPTRLVDPQLSSYQDSPLAGSPNGTAIEAFIDFARAEGFTEVTR